MPAVTRELSVIYGSATVGGTTDRLLDFPIRIDEEADQGTVEFSFLTTAATEALFATEIAALETAFRTPRQRLRVVQGAQTLYDFNPATNTGFDHVPTIIKADDVGDTGRSRYYTIRVVFQLPADVYAQSGRRDSRVTLDFTPARRRELVIEGTYTALTGNEARAQYVASIDAYASTLISGFGGTYELTEETATQNDTDKLLEFRRVYSEIIFNQSAGTLDDVRIVRQDLRVTVGVRAPGDSSRDAERLLEVNIDYMAWIDKNQTTDLVGIWLATIRPFILSESIKASRGGAAAVVHEDPTYDFPENRIQAKMRVLVTGRSRLLELRIDSDDILESGMVLLPIWSGGPFDRYVYQGPATHQRRITRTERHLGVFTLLHAGSRPLGVTGGSGFYAVSRHRTLTPMVLGTAAESLQTTLIRDVMVFEYAKGSEGDAENKFQLFPELGVPGKGFGELFHDLGDLAAGGGFSNLGFEGI